MSGVRAGAAGALRPGDRRRPRRRRRDARGGGRDVVVADLAELVPRRRGMKATRSAPTRWTAAGSRSTPGPWSRPATRPDDLGVTETLFSVANGYLGMRGNPEEGRPSYAHGTFLNGFHETWPIRHAEAAFGFARTGQTLVNVPDTKVLKIYVDDEPLTFGTVRPRALRALPRLPRRRAAPQPDLAHAVGQAGPDRLHPDGLDDPAAPRDDDPRGRGADRRRPDRDLLADPQPAGRPRRVPTPSGQSGADPSTRARPAPSTSGCCSRG